MSNDRLEALLWGRIDDTIDPEELAELEAHLAEHPEPREIEQQIATIAEELDRLDVVQPPPALRERIDSALSRATPPAAQRTSTPRAVSAPAWPARWLPLAASLLVGVAVGYLLHPEVFPKIDEAAVAGALLPTLTAGTAGEAVINLGDDFGKLIVASSADLITVDFTVTAESGLDLVLEAESGEVNLRSLTHIEGIPSKLWVNGPRIDLHADGPGHHTLSIRASDRLSPIRVFVASETEVLAERRIAAAPHGKVQ